MASVQIVRRIGAAVSASATLTAGQHTPVTAIGGSVTMTLPTPADVGASLSVEKTDASVNTVAVTGNIRGVASTTITLYWQNELLELTSDASGSWWPTGGHKTKTSLDAAYTPKSAAGPLTKFLASLPARQSRTIMVVVLGDSNANGSGTSTAQATSWLDRFGAYLHSAYPLDSGAVQPNWVNYTTFSTTTPGIQLYNNGKSGARSDQYLVSTTEINAFAAAQTALYIHIIGTNDWIANVDPAVFKTNVSNAITAINTASTVPTVHVLVRMFARSQAGHTYPWTSYGAKLAELAAANPTGVLCFDFEQAFANATNGAIGADGTDPWGFITGPHLTDQGQMFFADLMRDAFDLRPAGAGVTAANPALTNTTVPTIMGTTTQGQTLTATNGSWSATPESYSYQWKRNGIPITGATATTYTLAAADVGTTITVTVQAAKTYYTSGWANTAATATISASGGSTAPGAPTGLGATAGNASAALSWTAPASNGGSAITDYLVEYQPSGGAWATFTHAAQTTTTITVTGLTNGVIYLFRVSAINSIGTSAASGTATATPTAPALTNTVAPAISPTSSVTTGTVLTTTNGAWSATPDSYTYQWNRAGAAISGATATTYTVVTGDLANAITCTVTAIKATYTSGSATSNTVTPAAGGGSTTTETWTGTNGASWPAAWTTGGTCTIQNNMGDMTTSSYYAAAVRSGMTGVTGDFDLTLTWAISGQTGNTTVFFGVSDQLYSAGSASPFNGYAFAPIAIANGSVGGLAINRYAAGSSTTLSQSYPSVSPGVGGFKVRVQRSGATINAKLWAADATEPGSWLLTATDASPLSAVEKVFIGSGGDTATHMTVDNLTANWV